MGIHPVACLAPSPTCSLKPSDERKRTSYRTRSVTSWGAMWYPAPLPAGGLRAAGAPALLNAVGWPAMSASLVMMHTSRSHVERSLSFRDWYPRDATLRSEL